MKQINLFTILSLFSFLFVIETSQAQNNALNFDGVNDIATAVNASSLISNSSMSMTCWVNLENPAAGWPDFDGVLGFRNNSNADFYILQLSSTNYEARFRNSAGVNFDVNSAGVNLNTWQHLAFTYDGSAVQFFIDGLPVGSTPANGFITSNTEDFDLGFTTFANQFDLDGSLDEVSLWSRGLTPAEVLCIYNDGVTSASVSQSNLELYYDMNQGTAGGFNFGIFQLIDQMGNINAGMSNFNWFGATSNFIASPITFTPCAIVLPVELLNFKAESISEREVELSWQTLSETENDYFIIERSFNGTDWAFLSKIDGAGNSSEELFYSTTDLSPLQGVSYYRLTQVDFDGNETMSDTKSVVFDISEYSELNIFPNPTNGILKISGDEELFNTILLFNSLGKEVTIQSVSQGESILTIDLSGLESGVYFLRSDSKVYRVVKN